jgi:hypothetical protein
MEVKEFHVIDCKMSDTDEKYANMHLILDDARGNSAEAQRLYDEMFPNHQTPSRYFEHQL